MPEIRVLDDPQVRQALARLEPRTIIEALRAAFAGLANGSSVQPATVVMDYPDGAGDCMFFPGLLWNLDSVGVTVGPYAPGRRARGLAPTTEYTLVMSARDGEPWLLCDSRSLTTARTAATTLLALEYLAPASPATLAVIGAGPIAVEHLRYAGAFADWRSIRIHSPSLLNGSSDAHVQRRSALQSMDLPVPLTMTASVETAVRDADVILLCTTASAPVIDLGWVTRGAIVTSIATDGPNAHEVDPSALNDLSVFCDYRGSGPAMAAEMRSAVAAGWWSTDRIVADLPELVTGGVDLPEGTRFFRSCGMGIEDLAMAALLR